MNSQNFSPLLKSLLLIICYQVSISYGLAQADTTIVMENDLVNSALINSAETQKLGINVQIAEEEQLLHKNNWWTDGLTVEFNYNEAHAQNDNDLLVQGFIFPRYNFRAAFNIGNIFNNKREQKIKSLEVKVAQSELAQEMSELKSQVRESYQNYLYAEELLGLRIQAEVDASESYTLASALFEAGELGLEEFKKSASDFFTAKEATLEARLNKEVAKIQLEGLIGQSLDQ